MFSMKMVFVLQFAITVLLSHLRHHPATFNRSISFPIFSLVFHFRSCWIVVPMQMNFSSTTETKFKQKLHLFVIQATVRDWNILWWIASKQRCKKQWVPLKRDDVSIKNRENAWEKTRQAMYVYRNIHGKFAKSLLPWKSNRYYIVHRARVSSFS